MPIGKGIFNMQGLSNLGFAPPPVHQLITDMPQAVMLEEVCRRLPVTYVVKKYAYLSGDKAQYDCYLGPEVPGLEDRWPLVTVYSGGVLGYWPPGTRSGPSVHGKNIEHVENWWRRFSRT